MTGLAGERKRWGESIEKFDVMEGKLVGERETVTVVVKKGEDRSPEARGRGPTAPRAGHRLRSGSQRVKDAIVRGMRTARGAEAASEAAETRGKFEEPSTHAGVFGS